MKSFWWFKENSIAGMARPGFNCTRWFEYTFDEAILVGWFGQHSSGYISRSSLAEHMNVYVPKLAKFYKLTPGEVQKSIELLLENTGITKTLKQIKKKTEILESFDVSDSQVFFNFSIERLNKEIHFLKSNDIEKVVSLTEQHHNKDSLAEHFDVYHLGITDLAAPKIEQVHQLADIIRDAQVNRHRIAVHCLAGLGRTSTMLITSHLILGESLQDLKNLVSQKNPQFVMVGSQADFVHEVAEKY